jgi:hypothetical protein
MPDSPFPENPEAEPAAEPVALNPDDTTQTLWQWLKSPFLLPVYVSLVSFLFYTLLTLNNNLVTEEVFLTNYTRAWLMRELGVECCPDAQPQRLVANTTPTDSVTGVHTAPNCVPCNGESPFSIPVSITMLNELLSDTTYRFKPGVKLAVRRLFLTNSLLKEGSRQAIITYYNNIFACSSIALAFALFAGILLAYFTFIGLTDFLNRLKNPGQPGHRQASFLGLAFLSFVGAFTIYQLIPSAFSFEENLEASKQLFYDTRSFEQSCLSYLATYGSPELTEGDNSNQEKPLAEIQRGLYRTHGAQAETMSLSLPQFLDHANRDLTALLRLPLATKFDEVGSVLRSLRENNGLPATDSN